MRALPAVESAALATSVPLDIHGLPTRAFALEGRARPDGTLDQALTNTVTPGYFATMQIPLRAGADFAALDDTVTAPQAIVNEEFVRQYLGDAWPIGRRLEASGRPYILTGVVANSLSNAFGEPPHAGDLSLIARSAEPQHRGARAHARWTGARRRS